MNLFLSIEAQNCTENGLADILREITNQLGFLTDETLNANNDKYGTEFKEIAIIPSCMEDSLWNAFGWKERKQIWRKKGEADIRLRMDYDRYIRENPTNQRLLFIDIIIRSIQVVQERSKGDFKGNLMIEDILLALNISIEQLIELRD